MPQHLGQHNQQLQLARTLLTHKGRKASGRFAFEGATLLAEALASPLSIEAVYTTEECFAREDVLRRVPDGRVFFVTPPALAKISDVDTPNGIVAVAKIPRYDAETLMAGDGPLVLLAGLNDPGNVGTLVRSAEAFGLAGLLTLEGGADPYQPKCVRAAMGAAFRLPIATITAEKVGTTLGDRTLIAAARGGIPLPEYHFPKRAVIAIGHERHGFGQGLPKPGATISIPHHGPTESLNAAVAGSIVLYALSSQ